MEDAATAEISRSQIWQWIRSPQGRARRRPQGHARALPRASWRRSCARSRARRGHRRAYDEAAWLLDRLVRDDEFVDFLTEPAYEFVAGMPEPVEAVA